MFTAPSWCPIAVRAKGAKGSCSFLVLRQVEFARETARDSQNGWMVDRLVTGWPGTIPSKDGATVPPGSARSLRGQTSSRAEAGRVRARNRARFPEPPCHGLARYCSTGRIAPDLGQRSEGSECPIPAASARDSQQGWCYSTGPGSDRSLLIPACQGQGRTDLGCPTGPTSSDSLRLSSD